MGSEGFCCCFLCISEVMTPLVTLIIILIMEICKAPTLRLIALNKHTHIMYIETENVIKKKKKKKEERDIY